MVPMLLTWDGGRKCKGMKGQGEKKTDRHISRLTQAKLHHPGGLANSSYFVYKDRFSAELWRGYPRGIGTIVNDIVGTRCGVRRVLDLSV